MQRAGNGYVPGFAGLAPPVGFMAIAEDDYLRIRRRANPFQAAQQMAWFRSPAAIA